MRKADSSKMEICVPAGGISSAGRHFFCVEIYKKYGTISAEYNLSGRDRITAHTEVCTGFTEMTQSCAIIFMKQAVYRCAPGLCVWCKKARRSDLPQGYRAGGYGIRYRQR
jgi:hypothetical protein